jgi:hypothetical protein
MVAITLTASSLGQSQYRDLVRAMELPALILFLRKIPMS